MEQLKDSPYEVRLLDPANVRLVRSQAGVLSMEYGEERHAEVWLFRAFPLSRQDEYISVRTAKGEEIGLLERLTDLNEASLTEARNELKLRYLVPTVTHIEKIKQYPGMWVWELETTLGPVKLSMRNLHEHIQTVGPTRLLLSDLDGNRCEIKDIETLNAHSQKQLSKVI